MDLRPSIFFDYIRKYCLTPTGIESMVWAKLNYYWLGSASNLRINSVEEQNSKIGVSSVKGFMDFLGKDICVHDDSICI